jgi:hypothetical protein
VLSAGGARLGDGSAELQRLEEGAGTVQSTGHPETRGAPISMEDGRPWATTSSPARARTRGNPCAAGAWRRSARRGYQEETRQGGKLPKKGRHGQPSAMGKLGEGLLLAVDQGEDEPRESRAVVECSAPCTPNQRSTVGQPWEENDVRCCCHEGEGDREREGGG